MRSYLQAGMLVLILVVPVLVYLFLKTFGENHYGLRRYFPEDIQKKSVNGKTISDTTWHTIPDFKVVDQQNHTLSGADFKDKILVVDFFFTRCPGICPKMSAQLGRVQESFAKDDDVKILSFSVDPMYDQPQVLKKYAQKYNAIDGKWYMTTTNDKLKVFNLGFHGFKIPSDTVDQFLHSERIILVDKEKVIRGYYTGTNKNEIDRLITEISVLKYEYEHHK